MKFLSTYLPEKKIPPTPETLAAINKFAEESTKAGVLLMTGGLQKPTSGTRVRYSSGKHTVTDGPYPETKELIDGFALLQVGSKEEAIEVAKAFMKIAGDGECEILAVYDPDEVPH